MTKRHAADGGIPRFLQEHHSAVADEVKMHYVATMSSGLEMLRIAQVLQEPSITQCSRDIATAMPACELPGAVYLKQPAT